MFVRVCICVSLCVVCLFVCVVVCLCVYSLLFVVSLWLISLSSGLFVRVLAS